MKRTVFASAVAVAWCVAVPWAQQSAPAPKAEPAHKVFLLNGCLEVSATPVPTYKLTDASPIGQTPGPAGEPGAVGTSGEKASYALQPESGIHAQGMDAAALKAHAGRRVEVTMRPVEKPEPTPARFTVTEIKRVSGGC